MRAAGKTDKGKTRTNNEDTLLVDEQRGIFLVADGLGGHQAGEVASRTVVDVVHDYVSRGIGLTGDGKAVSDLLNEAIIEAHKTILEQSAHNRELRGMGTTLVALAIKDNLAYISHVGDSRAYLLRGDKIARITRDHTIDNYLVKRNIMTREQIDRLKSHILTQAIGTQGDVEPDTNLIALRPGDIMLLCSDGLTDMLSDKEIAEIILAHAGTPDRAVEELVDQANKKGGRDNISVVIVAV